MPKSALIVVALLILSALAWYIIFGNKTRPMPDKTESDPQIQYIPIGDSYTIGNGVNEFERWPNVLVKNLKAKGIDIELIANPAVSGYTVEDAIRNELPLVRKLQPDFVTVLIGANDNFRLKSPKIYSRELIAFLDELQSILNNPKNIVLITIPDYSISPAASGNNIDGISKSIEEYNLVIKSEAEKRGLKVADIFPVSQTMIGADDYIPDGLHPSAQGYGKWEKVISPVVFEFLKNNVAGSGFEPLTLRL